MAKKDTITLDEIKNAVIALRNKGVNPTYSNIRREIGDRGSNSTIAKFLTEIEAEEAIGADSIQAKDAFTAIWNQLRAVVLKEFTEKLSTQASRNAELLEELAARELAARDAIAKSSEAEASTRTLMDEMRKISTERESLAASIATMQSRLATAEQSLSSEVSQTERLKGVLATIRGYFEDRKDVSADLKHLFSDIENEWAASPGTGIALRLSSLNAEQQVRIDSLTAEISALRHERDAKRDEFSANVLMAREDTMQAKALLAAAEREVAFLRDQLKEVREEKAVAVAAERTSHSKLQERNELHSHQLAQSIASHLDASTQLETLKARYKTMESERDQLLAAVATHVTPSSQKP